tara:strand:+ start:1365 stop:1904 length:540 start_codon:yes stop_codon:yes gene_type:complete
LYLKPIFISTCLDNIEYSTFQAILDQLIFGESKVIFSFQNSTSNIKVHKPKLSMHNFYINNPIILLPFFCGLIIIVFGYIQLWRLRRSENPEMIMIFWSWLIGIIALLLGIFGQIYTMISVMDEISYANDISPSMISLGIKDSYSSSQVGLLVLVISLIIWGILYNLKQKKIILKRNDS